MALSEACGFCRRHRLDGISSRLDWHALEETRRASTLKSVLPGRPWVDPEGTFSELCVLRFRTFLDTLG